MLTEKPLASHTNSILPGVTAPMHFSSVEQLISPTNIHYREMMAIAIGGLAVKLACALILGGAHDHGLGDVHDHEHHRDLNL